MGNQSEIQWTDGTFNGWMGCTKVSSGCANCYAEADFDHRRGRVKWGPEGQRVRTSPQYWFEPIRLQRRLEKTGERFKMFAFSLADVFERNDQLKQWLLEFHALVMLTPNIDWQILTKRPDHAVEFYKFMNPGRCWDAYLMGLVEYWKPKISEKNMPLVIASEIRKREEVWPPQNIWMGASVENQEAADARLPHLLKLKAMGISITFASYEPALGPVNFLPWMGPVHEDEVGIENPDQSIPNGMGVPFHDPWLQGIDWVIVGGESGDKARPFDIAWARKTIEQCRCSDVACFVKQLGSKPRIVNFSKGRFACALAGDSNSPKYLMGYDYPKYRDKKGGDMSEWPEDLRVREFPK